METSTILLLIGAIILVVLIVYYLFTGSSSSTSSFLKFEEQTVYASDSKIYATSDGIENIYYSRSNGIYKFNTTSKLSVKILPNKVNGMAFSENCLLFTENNGILYSYNFVSNPTILETGISDLYDTIGGFHYSIGGVSGSSQSDIPANGNYGLISFEIK